MFQLMPVAAFQNDGDYVEAGRVVMQLVAGEPGESGLADLALFEGGDGKLRWAVGKGFAGFDLDKDKGVAILGDYVNFATLAAEIPLDDLQAAALQKSCGKLFATSADAGVFISFAGGGGVLLSGGVICPSHVNT